MNLSEPNILRAFLEAVKIISDDFVETSINELEETSFVYKGTGGYLIQAGMSLEPEIDSNMSSDDTILLSGEDGYPIAVLFVEYIDDEDEYEDEDDRPFFIRRMLAGTYLLEPYEFDNTEEYEHDNRAAEAMNKYK